MEFYWELKYGDYKDLRSVMIPPASVVTVKKRWDSQEPIHLSSGSIPANQIRSFEITDRPFNPVPMIEEVSQVFKEPMYNDDGEVRARWVKQIVTKNKWDKHYSSIPSYKLLDDNGNMATIAFVKAIHDINPAVTPYCTGDEVKRLTGRT